MLYKVYNNLVVILNKRISDTMYNGFNIKHKDGFSLAEVLIVLALIGVLAVMTIPTLMTHTNNTKFRSQFKRTLSNLNQAVKVSEAHHDLNFATVTSRCLNSTDSPATKTSMCSIMNGAVAGTSYYTSSTIPSMSGVGKYSPGGTGITEGEKGFYMFADGSIFAFDLNLVNCSMEPGDSLNSLKSICYGYIDVNGTKSPNKPVSCSDPSKTEITRAIGDCIVRDNSVDMGDIFPVAIHDSVVEPLTNAAKYVLNSSVMNTKD